MPNSRLLTRNAGVLACLIIAMLFSTPALATRVTLKTTLGDVVIELYDEETPATVANFMNYVNDGRYDNTFIHRSVPDFIIQGGGYTYIDDLVDAVPQDDPVVNEPGISNLRGTIAMAKLSGDPDSATSQWFINLGDNSENLDAQNGGFTVFGEVVGDGMDIIDAIAALPITNAGTTFSDIPLIDYPGAPTTITDEYLVMTSVEENTDVVEFPINVGLNDAWYDSETDGQGFYLVVFPESENMSVAWFTFDTERPDESVQAILGGPGQRWLTAQGPFTGDTATLTIYNTQGGIFDSGIPVPMTAEYGTMIVEFIDCMTGTITYDIPSLGLQGVIPIARVSNENVPLCEALE